ncbi:MAG: acyl--CoA ligase [Methyloceanibacter sp.]|jgi:acyl-CoA synthetase (AMP-forming)/AMP-acid ligase II|nr:acyl--CoA ligase [Methyloceanibacter sp.]
MSILAFEHSNDEQAATKLTADGLFRRHVGTRPYALALADPLNRAALGLGPARRYRFGEADVAIDALAAFFVDLGLKPGDKIAIQLPNIAEQVLSVLAAWRAGLTAVMLPMLWRRREIGIAADLLEPKALLGVGQFAGGHMSEMLCDIAVAQLSIRYVLGFGDNLADGVTSLDEVLQTNDHAPPPQASTRGAASLVTFTARVGAPIAPLFRDEDSLLAQGRMTALALSLQAYDVVLNPYPLSGTVGLGLGLMPWLISGATLVQHQPFEYANYVRQLKEQEATVIAAPSPVLAALGDDGVLADPACHLRAAARVWSMPELAGPAQHLDCGNLPVFDVYPLGDLMSVVRNNSQRLAHGKMQAGDDGALFVEIRTDGTNELSLRGPAIPCGAPGGPLEKREGGYVGTGLRGKDDSGTLEITCDLELLHHGGFTVAAAELDTLYRSFPYYLDAACFALFDPIVGDRIFAAVVPEPDEPVSLEALHAYLHGLDVAPYKFPDQIVVVRDIPRDASDRVLRDQFLAQI